MVYFLLVFLLFEEPAARYFLEHGDQMMKAGQTEAAVSDYGRAIRIRLDSPEGWLRRGHALTMLHRYHDAAEDFAQGAQLQPLAVAPLLDRTDALVLGGEWRAAADAAEQTLTKFPGNTRALQLRAISHLKLQEYALAESDYTELIRVSPNQPQPYLDRAAALEAAGHNQEALADCNRAVGLQPGSAEARMARARSYQKLAQDDLALADLNEAVRLRPDLPGARLARGSAYYAAGQNAKAAEDVHAILQKYPEFKGANELLAKIEPGAVPQVASPVAPTPKTEVAAVVSPSAPAEPTRPAEATQPSAPAQPVAPAVAEVRESTRAKLSAEPKLLAHVRPEPKTATHSATHTAIHAATQADMQAASAHYQAGRELLQHGKYQGAIGELSLAIEANSSNALALNARGFSYYMAHDYAHAAADLDEALRLKPDYANAKLNRAVLSKVWKDKGAAGQQLAATKPVEVPKANAAPVEVAVHVASTPVLNERRVDVREPFENKPAENKTPVAQNKAPVTVAAVPATPIVRGPVRVPEQAGARKTEKAPENGVEKTPPVETASVKAPAAPTPSPVSVLPRAKAAPEVPLPGTSSPDAASAEVHHLRGRELLQHGKFAEAIAELSLTIEARPDHALARNARGFAYYMARDYGHALADLNEALRLKPDYINAQQNRAVVMKAAAKAGVKLSAQVTK